MNLQRIREHRCDDELSEVSIDSHIVRRDMTCDFHGDGVTLDTASRPVSVFGDEEPVVAALGVGGRHIQKPFASREEVGEIALLNANFGRERNDAGMREYTRRNLKGSPASVLALQEAEEPLAQMLEAEPESAVADQALPPTDDGGRVDVYERPGARYLVIMGEEHGPTCLTAVRRSLAESVTRLHWYWRLDGTM